MRNVTGCTSKSEDERDEHNEARSPHNRGLPNYRFHRVADNILGSCIR